MSYILLTAAPAESGEQAAGPRKEGLKGCKEVTSILCQARVNFDLSRSLFTMKSSEASILMGWSNPGVLPITPTTSHLFDSLEITFKS